MAFPIQLHYNLEIFKKKEKSIIINHIIQKNKLSTYLLNLNSQNIQIKIIQIYEILKIKKIISIYLVSNLPKNS
jgi:hypothetical protein